MNNQLNLQVRSCKNGYVIWEQDIASGVGRYSGREWVAKDEAELGALLERLASEFKTQGRFN